MKHQNESNTTPPGSAHSPSPSRGQALALALSAILLGSVVILWIVVPRISRASCGGTVFGFRVENIVVLSASDSGDFTSIAAQEEARWSVVDTVYASRTGTSLNFVDYDADQTYLLSLEAIDP